jgi:hypothetical protein
MAVATRMAKTVKTVGFWLWTVQVLLAAVFLFAGGLKLVLPIEMLKGPVALPGAFLRFLGTAEVTGAFGLILPGLFGIRPRLTPLAASGLVIIMIGATTLSLIFVGMSMAALPFVVGLLATFVLYGRTRLAPLPARRARGSAGAGSLQPAFPAGFSVSHASASRR